MCLLTEADNRFYQATPSEPLCALHWCNAAVEQLASTAKSSVFQVWASFIWTGYFFKVDDENSEAELQAPTICDCTV